VHPGHIRHLKHAATQGDILLVSLTSDVHVNKGDGRPLFNQDLRAENLAALDFVDWVHVNPDDTAVSLVRDTQPDVYVKGREYEGNADPRFAAERAAVEAGGGRVVFSSGDIVFSSTALVAALEHQSDPFHARLRHLLSTKDADPAALHGIVERFAGRRVAVFGETITDTYVLCDRPDIASEGPVMSLRPLEHVSYDGGAAIVARHLAAMGARPVLVTPMATSVQSQQMIERLTREGVEVRAIPCEGAQFEKHRYLVGSQKVMKLDFARPISVDAAARKAFLGEARSAARGADAAIIADFGLGLFSPRMLAEVVQAVRPEVATLTADVSGPRNTLMKMRGLDLLCPTEHELRSAMNDFSESLNAVVWRFLEQTSTASVVVTMGADGLIAFDRLAQATAPGAAPMPWPARVRAEHVPALASHAIDTLGCGDALLAAATLARAAGGSLTSCAMMGSIAAAVQATRLGNDAVSAHDLRAGIMRLADARISITPSRIGARMAV
jgi:cytidyltransferase-like protein